MAGLFLASFQDRGKIQTGVQSSGKSEGVGVGLNSAQKVQEWVDNPGPLAREDCYHRTWSLAGEQQFCLSSLQGRVNIVFIDE